MANNSLQAKEATSSASVITADNLLAHWQGHRALTRRVIAAFSEEQLFNFSIGGMRPFSDLALEMLDMADDGVEGIVSGKWKPLDKLDHIARTSVPGSKEELLQRWDKVTDKINNQWPLIAPERFQEVDMAFGMYEAPIHGHIMYFIDNEIHHRGQGYVYLRALGIEPPAFWER